MEVQHLELDELNIEYEIRNLTNGPSNLDLLRAKIQAEESFPILIPQMPHAAAILDPTAEMLLCSVKLSEILTLLADRMAPTESLCRYSLSRLFHIRDRLFRLTQQNLERDRIKPLVLNCNKLIECVSRVLNTRRVEPNDFQDSETDIAPPHSPTILPPRSIQNSNIPPDSNIPAQDHIPRLQPIAIPQVDSLDPSNTTLCDISAAFSSSDSSISIEPNAVTAALVVEDNPKLKCSEILTPAGSAPILNVKRTLHRSQSRRHRAYCYFKYRRHVHREICASLLMNSVAGLPLVDILVYSTRMTGLID